jgi:outer membrane protein assembly factor BamB
VVSSTDASPPSQHFRADGGVSFDDSAPLPERFDPQSNLLWRQPLPPGHSTPTACGGSIFLTTYVADRQELATVALDGETGQVRWKRIAPATRLEPVHRTGSPASSTPACDGHRVYAFFGSYGLLCYDFDGQLLWSKPLGPFQDEFGAASSPVLVDDMVILNEDHDVDSFLLAVDQQTGETRWKTPRDEFTRSYSTPFIWQASGRKEIVVAGSLALIAYRPEDGRKVWWVRGISRIVDTTPVASDDALYVATWTPGGDTSDRITMEPFDEALRQHDANGNGVIALSELPEGEVRQRFFRMDLDQNGSLDQAEWQRHAKVFELAENVAIAVRPGGEGDVTTTHVEWIQRQGLPTVPSPVLYDGALYMVKDSGIFTSLDAASGQIMRRGRIPGRGNYYASLVAGDGKVYAASESGVVTVLRAGAPWQVLSHHDFSERIMATPVLSQGRIYLRTENALYCFAGT